MKKIVIAICCLIFIAHEGYSQVNQQYNMKLREMATIPPDPELASIKSFGNENVNLPFGQADITIPLYHVKTNSASLDLSLSYNHQGINIRERTDHYGKNWILNGIGFISKNVHGQVDENSSTGFNWNHTHSTTIGPNTVSGLQDIQALNNPYLRAGLGQIDLMPDVYSFSFMGYSGSFFYSPSDSRFYSIPHSKLIIEKMTGGTQPIMKITDDKGIQYYFEEYIAVPQAPQETGIDLISPQWYLTRVINPVGETDMTISYIDDVPIDAPVMGQQLGVQRGGTGGWTSLGTSGTSAVFGAIPLNFHTSQSKLIESIETPFEKINFSYTPRTDISVKLDKIELLDKNNNIKESRTFNYTTYNTQDVDQNKRPKLEEVSFRSTLGVSEYNYEIEYYSGDIPSLQSAAIDYWGFPNGSSSTVMMERFWNPYLSQYDGGVGKSRAPDFQHTREGILKKVTFPTGGWSEFEYELNEYGKVDNNNLSYEKHNGSKVNISISTTTTSSHTFTLTKDEIVNIHFYRDHCQGTPNPPCDTDPIIVNFEVNNSPVINYFTWVPHPGNTFDHQTFDASVLLSAGTYSFSLIGGDYYNYGSATFSYNNPAGYTLHKNKTCGGLRIKTITNFDPIAQNEIKRNFNYQLKQETDRSSGIVPNEGLFWSNANWGGCWDPNGSNGISGTNNGSIGGLQGYAVIGGMMIATGGSSCSVTPLCTHDFGRKYRNSESLKSLFFTDGKPVMYSQVEEIKGAAGEGGKIDYNFSYYNDYGGNVFPYAPKSSRSWKRGNLLTMSSFNDQGDIVARTSHSYKTEATVNRKEQMGQKVGFSYICNRNPKYNLMSYALMKNLSEWQYQDKKTTRTYVPGTSDYVETEEEYFYDNPVHIQMTRSKTTNSDGTTYWSHTKYPHDYNPPASSSDVMLNALAKMATKNMIAYPIEQYSSIDQGSGEKITGGKLTEYKEFSTDVILPWKENILEIDAPIASTTLSQNSNGTFIKSSLYKTKLTYDSYNSKGKLTQVTDENNISSSVWYTQDDLLPIAQFSNASLAQVYYNGFEESASGGTNNPKYGLQYESVTHFNAPNLPAGQYIVQWWERNNGVWAFKQEMVSHTSGTLTPAFATNVIDEVAIYPVGASFSAVNYNNKQEVIAKTAANGIGVKFEFDAMGRLELIRDHKNNIVKKYEYAYLQND